MPNTGLILHPAHNKQSRCLKGKNSLGFAVHDPTPRPYMRTNQHMVSSNSNLWWQKLAHIVQHRYTLGNLASQVVYVRSTESVNV